jgi:ribonuclease HII
MKRKIKKNKNSPDFREELKCRKNGCEVVVGLDEVGRGPLAGPVCAAAVCVLKKINSPQPSLKIKEGEKNSSLTPPSIRRGAPPLKIRGGWKGLKLRDSKQLTAKQREAWYKILTKHPDIRWGIGMVSEKIIDRINIFQATKLAMKKALLALEKKLAKSGAKSCKIDFLLLDGDFTIEELNIRQKAIIKGDERVFSCAAASIIAKVTRDRLMRNYAKKFTEYGFQNHKGYGTKKHLEALRNYGPCILHRRSFRLIY